MVLGLLQCILAHSQALGMYQCLHRVSGSDDFDVGFGPRGPRAVFQEGFSAGPSGVLKERTLVCANLGLRVEQFNQILHRLHCARSNDHALSND